MDNKPVIDTSITIMYWAVGIVVVYIIIVGIKLWLV